MKILTIALILVCCVVQTPDALAQNTAQPEPKFPTSERGREGWTILDCGTNDAGIVVDLSIKDSSGSSAFNEAAIEAVREWRFEPGAGRQLSVLLNFVFEQSQVHLSRKFIAHIQDVHRLIEEGELDAAKERIAAYRVEENIDAYELAYSLIAEGRVASMHGDKAEHLRVFRRAVINDGHWLERDKYLMLLHSIVVLEVQQQDFTSALENYALLTETRPGRKLAEGLDEPMQSLQAMLASGGDFPPPYKVADVSMTIERAGRVLRQDVNFRDDYFGEIASEDVNEREEF
jgi:TonB family protein